jgi:hypothetical protein
MRKCSIEMRHNVRAYGVVNVEVQAAQARRLSDVNLPSCADHMRNPVHLQPLLLAGHKGVPEQHMPFHNLMAVWLPPRHETAPTMEK